MLYSTVLRSYSYCPIVNHYLYFPLIARDWVYSHLSRTVNYYSDDNELLPRYILSELYGLLTIAGGLFVYCFGAVAQLAGETNSIASIAPPIYLLDLTGLY